MPKEHQTPADGEPPRSQDASSPQPESARTQASPAPLPDPFQFAVYLQRLAAGGTDHE